MPSAHAPVPLKTLLLPAWFGQCTVSSLESSKTPVLAPHKRPHGNGRFACNQKIRVINFVRDHVGAGQVEGVGSAYALVLAAVGTRECEAGPAFKTLSKHVRACRNGTEHTVAQPDLAGQGGLVGRTQCFRLFVRVVCASMPCLDIIVCETTVGHKC